MNLRPATLDDMALLYRWRNDPQTIRALPNPRGVMWEEHRRWMLDRVARPGFYIAELEDHPVATLRLEPRLEVAIIVAPEARGRGIGPQALRLAGEAGPLLARIRSDNPASITAFERAGFSKVPEWLYERL